jgi:hypothetical protein
MVLQDDIKQAEAELKAPSQQPGYGIAALQVGDHTCAAFSSLALDSAAACQQKMHTVTGACAAADTIWRLVLTTCHLIIRAWFSNGS